MSVRERLKSDLKQAMKDRDRTAATTIKSALSAIDNAEAVPVAAAVGEDPMGRAGLSRDVPRRELDEDRLVAIVRAEADELRAAAEEYEGYGRTDRAAQLREAQRILEAYV